MKLLKTESVLKESTYQCSLLSELSYKPVTALSLAERSLMDRNLIICHYVGWKIPHPKQI